MYIIESNDVLYTLGILTEGASIFNFIFQMKPSFVRSYKISPWPSKMRKYWIKEIVEGNGK